MEHVADKLLGLKLKRDKRIRSALKHKIYVWEDFLLILIVISILWTGARISKPSLELLYPLVFIIISALSVRIRRLNRRIDALIEVLDDEIEEQLATKLRD